MVSGTITDASGRTLSGQVTEAFWYSVRHARPLAIGLNCALGAGELRPYVAELSRIADCFVSAHPNAGLPNAFGEYDETPEAMARVVGEFATAGLVNIVGGCCGTTPGAHRARSPRRRRRARRARRPSCRRRCGCRGLEPCVIDEDSLFVNVGERTNITGSARFRRLIKEDDYGTALGVARQQVEAGAQVIDVNMDEGMIDGVAAMDRFLKLDRLRAGHLPGAADDRLEQVGGHRGRAEGHPGQADHQLDLDEGGRGRVPRPRPAGPQVRRGRGRHGVRRGRPGRQPRAPPRDLRPGLPAARRRGRLPRRGRHHRPQHLRRRHRHRGARGLRQRLHRGHRVDQGEPAARAGLRRRLERLVQLPRQQRRARGDPRRVPLPRHQGRHGHGHRQRRCAAALRHRRREAARRHRGRRAQPTARRRRPAAHDRRGVPRHRRGRRRGGRGVAVAAGGRADHARPRQGHRRRSSSRTPRSCGWRSRPPAVARSRSSRVR